MVIDCYTGFQIKNGEFYILRSVVYSYLRTTYRTFQNYLTELGKFDLLEKVYTARNQYTQRTRWRMRLDVIFTKEKKRLYVSEIAEKKSDSIRRKRPPPEAESPVSDSKSETREVRELKERISVLEAQVEDLTGRTSERRGRVFKPPAKAQKEQTTEKPADKHVPSRQSAQPKRKKSRAARKKQRNSAKNQNTAAKTTPTQADLAAAVAADSTIVQQINAQLRRMKDAPPLSRIQRQDAKEIEAEWMAKNEGAEIPEDFITYALNEAQSSEKSYHGYALAVLRRCVQDGFTEQQKASPGYCESCGAKSYSLIDGRFCGDCDYFHCSGCLEIKPKHAKAVDSNYCKTCNAKVAENRVELDRLMAERKQMLRRVNNR